MLQTSFNQFQTSSSGAWEVTALALPTAPSLSLVTMSFLHIFSIYKLIQGQNLKAAKCCFKTCVPQVIKIDFLKNNI